METTQNENIAKEEMGRDKKHHRLMGILLFSVACGLLAVRSVVGLISDYISDTASEVIFNTVLQIGVLVVLPVLFYIFAFKLKPKEILAFSSIRKTKWQNYILAAIIGFLAIFVTMGISMIWQNFIAMLGYTHSVPKDTLPDTFNIGVFLLSLFLTALLPGFCEEFMMRGGYLTTVRKSNSFIATVVIMGISFGLFHQYITQVFYTALFGALTAALTLRCRSIIPAMIIHFFNNGMSVYLDSAEKYGWVGGNYSDFINETLMTRPAAMLGIYLLICILFAGFVILFWKLNAVKDKKEQQGQPDVFDGGQNGGAAGAQAQNGQLLSAFRPTLGDNVFYYGAAVVAALTTIFTFIWGWMV